MPGVASAADAWPAGERLRRFVDEGRHGDMEWMETTLDRRAHPTAMWDEAKTAIVLGMNYDGQKVRYGENPLKLITAHVIVTRTMIAL